MKVLGMQLKRYIASNSCSHAICQLYAAGNCDLPVPVVFRLAESRNTWISAV